MDKKSTKTKSHPKSGPAHPDYANLLRRCQSFRGWPKTSPFKPRQLADRGFFYLGLQDRLKCFMCGGIVEQWDPEYGPWVDHQRMSPKCRFETNSNVGVDQPVSFKDIVEPQDGQKCLLIMCPSSKSLVKLRKQDLDQLFIPMNFNGKVCLSHYMVAGMSRDEIKKFYSQHKTVPEVASLHPEAFKRVRDRDIYRHVNAVGEDDGGEDGEDDGKDDGEDDGEGKMTPHKIFIEHFQNIHSYCLPIPRCLCPPLKNPVQKSKGKPHSFADTIYTQLGAAATIDEIYDVFKFRSKLGREDINVNELRHHEEECTNGLGCEPYEEELIDFESKVTVFVKRSKSECKIHKFLVIGILIQEAVSESFEERVTKAIKENYLPVAIRPTNTRGAEFSAVLKRQQILCECNKCSLSISMGCSNMRLSSKKCKYSQTKTITSKNCQRFSLGHKHDLPGLEHLCDDVADSCSAVLKQYAPVAWYNLCEHLKDATLCQLGTQQRNAFAGMSIVSQYVAHPHHDDHNFEAGCTAILSFKELGSNQCHVLPQYSLHGDKAGLAMVLPNRSIFLEVARMERHASARIDQPVDYLKPSRLGLVCYTHSGITKPFHGSLALMKKNS